MSWDLPSNNRNSLFFTEQHPDALGSLQNWLVLGDAPESETIEEPAPMMVI